MNAQEESQQLLWGRTKDLLLPDGKTVTIREQNGNDDDILSNTSKAKDLTNQSDFIRGIVVKADWTASGRLSLDDIDKMLIKNKYFILFASRIHSIGEIVKFAYDWGKSNGGEISYEDDLSKYLWDFSEPIPEKGEDDYFEFRMQPYVAKANELQYFATSSGKELRYRCLNICDERELMKLDREAITKNRELIQRDLELKDKDGKWVKIHNFMWFNKRDMTEIHKEVNHTDSAFMPITEIENPREDVPNIMYPIIASSSFFFPEEI